MSTISVINIQKQQMGRQQDYKHSDITAKIIECFYKVYNTLGYGFLEKVYENAMFLELRETGLFVEKQKPIKVYYKKHKVGDYYADLIVSEAVIVELKATQALCPEYEYQLINYLKATEIEVGLLLNFGKSPQFKRKIFSNESSKKEYL
ncbi:GxxExxY protein [Flavobacteriaceae bacterium 3-367]|uniref:GxxExxY protein n=1 Tax=Eudoraea algarum TaxID=3417568 RepID=UPI00327A6BA3